MILYTAVDKSTLRPRCSRTVRCPAANFAQNRFSFAMRFAAYSNNFDYTLRVLLSELHAHNSGTPISITDETRSGANLQLFYPEHLITGEESAAHLITPVDISLDGKSSTWCLNRRILSILAEQCTGLQGVWMFHSFGGGTEPGYTALLMVRLNINCPEKNKFQIAVYPAPRVSQQYGITVNLTGDLPPV
ncbi:Tubulin,Tubulin/FtsZ, GTPase domain,Alpha tubulin [Cinara cedri]|uniref:Tubulin,Tubulin/FtsZ, GTPase domain,Alpha tubulin n=1 Tax=Cinara cedri TaxID=506608 RepID=A0A5E4MM29_9HEMI|nr:Tubulin,Tubulin/FtsZ, GTPase domain,Alpha tubulin [Cinara cedri]